MYTDKVKNFGGFEQEVESEINMKMDKKYLKGILSGDNSDTIVNIIKQNNKFFENYVGILNHIEKYEDILTDDLVYSNRINNILF